jgi:Flp pilus assembly protein TadG
MDSSEGGAVLVTVAVSLTVMFGVAALAIDLGRLYVLRTQLQNAADAAALAGAFSLIDINQGQPAAATNAAITLANGYNTLTGPVVITAANVSVDTIRRTVTVSVPQPNPSSVLLTFAKAAGVPSFTIAAYATAQAGAGAAERSLKPVFVPNSTIRAASDASTTMACSGTEPHTIFYPQGHPHYGELTTYAKSYLPSYVNTEVVIRPTTPKQEAAPGQFYSIDFGGGGSTYEQIIAASLAQAGITDEVGCGNTLSLKTGNMVGPTISGFDAMIGNPPDIWVGPSQYKNASTGVIWDTSPSLMVAPVFDDCTQQVGPGGNIELKVVGYVEVFVDRVDQSGGGVYGHIVSATGCSVGGSEQGVPSTSVGTPAPTGAYGTPIQLVH